MVAEAEWPGHPWAAVIERYVDPPLPATAERTRVAVIWWPTRAGRQPVLLVRRIRLE